MSLTAWFRARASGLGWTPITWQGWVVTLAGLFGAVGVNLMAIARISGVLR